MSIVTAATVRRIVEKMLPGLVKNSEELEFKIKDLLAGYQKKGEYAPKNHTHDQKVVPLRLVERGAEVASMLGTKFALEGHSHDEFARELIATNKRIDDLPSPTEPFDPTPILDMLRALESQVKNLARDRMTVHVNVEPVVGDAITVEADYIVVENCTPDVLVHDANGVEGGTRVTSSGNKSVVRAVYEKAPAQPLTFTFLSPVPPPTLCSIGSTRAKETI